MVSTSTKYKIMLIGDQSVGKTCAIHRFCDQKYDDHFKATVVVDIRRKCIDLDGDAVQLEIWDTAGMERFDSVSLLSLRNIKGILLMYDITSLSSFNTIKRRIAWIEGNVSCDVVKVLVGNKFDAPEEERKVSSMTGLQLANELDVPFFEVSSKANINIDEAFLMLAKNIRKQIIKDELVESIRSLEEEKKKKEDQLVAIIKLEEEEKLRTENKRPCCNISNNFFIFRLK